MKSFWKLSIFLTAVKLHLEETALPLSVEGSLISFILLNKALARYSIHNMSWFKDDSRTDLLEGNSQKASSWEDNQESISTLTGSLNRTWLITFGLTL